MAKMIPSEFNDLNKSEAEKHLYYKLNQAFDENWIIFHSYSIEGRNRENKIIDAEIDFLILNKDYGILVLEIKGGEIKYENGKWYQNSREIRDPYQQAMSNKYLIRDYLKKQFHAELPVGIGHAVCFPDDFDSSSYPITPHQDITITGETVNYLFDYVTAIMQDQKKPGYKIDSRMLLTLEKSLMPIFEYGSSIVDKFGQEKRKVFSLTEQQCEFLIFISEHKKALIKGCAGSGKTIMAVKKAKHLAFQGKNVLFLCINVMLSENLALELQDCPNITVKTYHNFCGEQIDDAGLKPEFAKNRQELFQKAIPEKFMELISKNPIKFDAVIVDEGQDFKEDYWITVAELVKDDGYFYVFYDPDQNIFSSELKFPDLGTPFILNKNCRNTKKIYDELKQFASMEIRINDEAPEGSEIIRYEFQNKAEVRSKLSQILHDLISNQNLKENQIAILGTHQLNNTSLGKDRSVGKFTIVENGFAGTNIIPYYTCMKYKGLEADVIILLDYDDERWQNPATRYTAISRAKHLLYILKLLDNVGNK